MIDQLKIESTSSYDDFDASVKERKISAPTKKSIKETVPFSNETYDFSKINGELYWNERSLEYVFEIIADTPEDLEIKKQKFLDWVMNVSNEKLYDPYIEDYYFLATYDDIDIDDSEVEKTTITVKFTAYPYMISNEKTIYQVTTSTTDEVMINILNESSHRITPTLKASVPLTFKIGNLTYSMGATEVTDESVKLEKGLNYITVQKTPEVGALTIEFYKEVF